MTEPIILARPRLARRLAAVALLATGVVAINSQSSPIAPIGAGAASGPSLSVSPSTGLTTQSVTVSWTNFANPTLFGNNFVTAYQCKANPQSLSDCYTPAPFPSSANGNGTFIGVTGADLSGSINFEVRDSAQLPELGCDSDTPCSIVAFDGNSNIPANALPDGAVVAPISFARSNTDCPIPTKFDITSGGEASTAQQAYRWAASKCTGNGAITVDFTESSSNNARDTFLAGEIDTAISSLGAPSDELAVGKDTKSIKYAPVSTNAVVLAFGVNDASTGQPITDMTLNARLVARLITDSQLLGFFQDPEFLELNPGHNWPSGGASQPMLRAERNADTRILTDWMYRDADAKDLIAGKDKYRVRVMPDFLNKQYPVDNFEIAASDSTGFIPHTGELDGARRVFYRARPDGNQSNSQGYIGIMSRSNAIRFGLPMAKVVNAAGVAVGPDTAGVAAGLSSRHDVDGVSIPDPATTDRAAYPLTKIDYAMVRTSVFTTDSAGTKTGDPAKAAALKAFLGYAVGGGQSDLAVGYQPLPADLTALAKSVIDSIAPLGSTPQTTTTTAGGTTTTTGSTETTVTDATTPGFVDNGSGSGACCSSSPDTIAIGTPTDGGGNVGSGEGDGNNPSPLKYALTAPAWVPIADIGPATTTVALPVLLTLGAIALLVSCLWPLATRLLQFRKRVVTAEVGS